MKEKKYLGIRISWLFSVIYLSIWNAIHYVTEQHLELALILLLVLELLIPSFFSRLEKN